MSQVTSRGWRSRSAAEPRPEPLGRAGGEVLDEDVGARQQPLEQRQVVGALDVERERFLAAVDPDEVGRLAVHRAVVAAGEVALVALDLDDARAGVGEAAAAVGGGDGLLERDHQHALEGALARRVPGGRRGGAWRSPGLPDRRHCGDGPAARRNCFCAKPALQRRQGARCGALNAALPTLELPAAAPVATVRPQPSTHSETNRHGPLPTAHLPRADRARRRRWPPRRRWPRTARSRSTPSARRAASCASSASTARRR